MPGQQSEIPAMTKMEAQQAKSISKKTIYFRVCKTLNLKFQSVFL
ncbi:unnamed protein product, partial [Brassica rapa subsp. narinosa]